MDWVRFRFQRDLLSYFGLFWNRLLSGHVLLFAYTIGKPGRFFKQKMTEHVDGSKNMPRISDQNHCVTWPRLAQEVFAEFF